MYVFILGRSFHTEEIPFLFLPFGHGILVTAPVPFIEPRPPPGTSTRAAISPMPS